MEQPESQDAINQREWESSWNWSRYGFYSSKADARLWVPKRPGSGSGSALNMAQPGAKTFLAALCVVPVVLGVVLVALSLFG